MTAGPAAAVRVSLPAIAATGMQGSRLELPAATPTDADFASLLRRLIRHRLVGLASAAHAEGRLLLTDAQATALTRAQVDALCTCLHLEAALLELAQALSEAGVRFRVIKGPASAHLDYPSPELRHFGDLDLLVRSEQTDLAKAVLGTLGYTRSTPEPRPGFDRRFGKGATYVAGGGTNVDLHRTFVMGPLGLRIGLDDIWAEADSFTLAGETVETLAPAHRLLAACYNAVVGDTQPRLSTLRDIINLCLSDRIVATEAQETAAKWGGEYILARGIAAAWTIFDVADVVKLSAWALRFDSDHDGKRLVALYHDAGAGYSGLSWATARILPLPDRIAFLGALAFPAGGRLGKHGWGLRERLRRAVRGYHRASR